MGKSKVAVFVVDDDPSVPKALKRLLSPLYRHVTLFSCAEEFLQTKPHPGPACLILDYKLPGLNGLELQKRLRATQHLLPIVFISGKGDISSSVSAMKAGAIDFLTKPIEPQALLYAVKRALTQSHRLLKEEQERKSIESRLKLLTNREQQILFYVAKGYLNKQIAFHLRISEKTVKVHRARVMHKMRANSLAELIRLTQKSLQNQAN